MVMAAQREIGESFWGNIGIYIWENLHRYLAGIFWYVKDISGLHKIWVL